jgi:hypothetical protein
MCIFILNLISPVVWMKTLIQEYEKKVKIITNLGQSCVHQVKGHHENRGPRNSTYH